MQAQRHIIRRSDFAAHRWILEADSRSAIVESYLAPADSDALVGRTVSVDGCEYRCVGVSRGAARPAAAGTTRLRLYLESL